MLEYCSSCQNWIVYEEGQCPVCGAHAPLQAQRPGADVPGDGVEAEYAAAVEPVLAAAAEQQALIAFHQQLFAVTPRVWVTPAIILANVAVFIAMAVATGSGIGVPGIRELLDSGANYGPLTLDQQSWRLASSMFIHLGLVHLGLNMWALWNLGGFTERLVGNPGMVVLYLISGLGGSLASVYWNPTIVSAGASGAIFGVFGGLMGFLVIRPSAVPRRLLAGLKSNAVQFLIYNVILGVAIPGIDLAAHAGGLVAGFLCGALMSQRLDQVTRGTRTWRNLLTLGVGLGGVCVASWPRPAARGPAERAGVLPDHGTPRRWTPSTRPSASRSNTACRTRTSPTWWSRKSWDRGRSWRSDSASWTAPRARTRAVVAACVQYLQARREAWQTLVRALRTQDPKLVGSVQGAEQDGRAAERELERELDRRRGGK